MFKVLICMLSASLSAVSRGTGVNTHFMSNANTHPYWVMHFVVRVVFSPR